jgi:hypothetical protein
VSRRPPATEVSMPKPDAAAGRTTGDQGQLM